MIAHQTLEKLHAMKLTGFVEALEEQRRTHDIKTLDFEERLALLVERQWLWKENRALAARLKYAQLKLPATLEDLNYTHARNLDRGPIEQLRPGDWITHSHNCLITGPTGVGKTHLACALGHQVCRDGHRVLYTYAPKLFRQLHAAHADGSIMKLFTKLSRVALLIIDDLGIVNATPKQYRDLLEILDDRNGQGATLLTSQLPVAQWHEIMGDATVANAIMDRLIHNAYRIELEGESLRKKGSVQRKKSKP